MSTIRATRDSVCMRDDCDAPHFESFNYGCEELLSQFVTKLYGYMVCIGGKTVRWTVYLNGSSNDMSSEDVVKAAYIYVFADGLRRSERLIPD